MKNSTLKFLIIGLIVLLNFIISTNNIAMAQFTIEAPAKKTEETSPKPEPVKPIKEAIIIDNTTLFYIGAKDNLTLKQRILDIKSNINNVIDNIYKNNNKFIDVEILETDNNFNITINNENILTVTDIDSEVNNVEKEQLALVWKSNIIQFIKNELKNTSTKKTESTTKTIGIAFLIFIILIAFAELFRIQISKLIILLVEKLFRKLDLIITNIKKKKHEEKKQLAEEIQDEDLITTISIEGRLEEKPVSTAAIEFTPENKLDKRVSVITNELKGLINILVRIAEVILVLCFIDYVLYTLPATYNYVKNFTHLCISIAQVASESLSEWLLSEYTWEAFGRILVIIVVTSIIIYISRIIGSALENIIQTILEDDKGRAKRVQTITKIVRTTLNILIIILAMVLILSELGINIAPIIAGAGIIGLAISFGSQSLVKDILNGVFILIENQFGIGDVITIGGISGGVEDMTLRVTVLRDLSGKVHIIPNSYITTVSVATKEWSRANLDIGIAYKEDIDTAIKIIKEVADKMYKEFPERIIAEPEVLGVNCLNDSSVDIKLIIKTKPGEQWNTEREFRRRIKYAFDEQNIEIPFPHTTLYVPQPVGYEAKQ